MDNLNLEEGKIIHDGQWFTADELADRIQNQINANNFKFAGLAASLEKLNTALENSRQVDIKLVLPKDVYEKLKAKGGDDDSACIKKAVMAYVGLNGSGKAGKHQLACLNGHASVPSGDAEGEKKAEHSSVEGSPRYKDHFLG